MITYSNIKQSTFETVRNFRLVPFTSRYSQVGEAAVWEKDFGSPILFMTDFYVHFSWLISNQFHSSHLAVPIFSYRRSLSQFTVQTPLPHPHYPPSPRLGRNRKGGSKMNEIERRPIFLSPTLREYFWTKHSQFEHTRNNHFIIRHAWTLHNNPFWTSIKPRTLFAVYPDLRSTGGFGGFAGAVYNIAGDPPMSVYSQNFGHL